MNQAAATSQASGERRDTERRVYRSVAHILVVRMEPVPVRTLDISPTGVGIVASVNPPQGTVCMLRLSLPKRGGGPPQTFNVQVKVVHSVLSREHDGFRVGMQFQHPSDIVVAAIRDFIG